MNDLRVESLAGQADKVAERARGWSAWRRDLAASAAREAGTDEEPGVNVVIVNAVREALDDKSEVVA